MMIPQYQTLPENFQIVISNDTPLFDLTHEQLEEIEQIWEEQQKTTHLFNGRLFSVKSIDNGMIVGEWIEYKYMIAQRHSPSLKNILTFTPLGISAVTICNDAILVGRRAPNLANYPDRYECAPSGGVDPSTLEGRTVNIKSLILKELEEETSLLPSCVSSLSINKLYFDPHTHIYELVARMTLEPMAMDLVIPTAEYPELFWLNRIDILPFLKERKEDIMPLTQILLMGEHL